MSDVVLGIGTIKGLFTARSSAAGWTIEGPSFAGQSIGALALDVHDGRPRLLAGATSSHWGPSVFRSGDLGRTWTEPDASHLAFPEPTGAAVERVWQLVGDPTRPDVVWAGVAPAALFRSEDGGATFALVEGLWDHPQRPSWFPGGGGLCLHTVVGHPHDPERMWVAISAGGVYATDDGGASWEARNRGITTPFLPVDEPEHGQCVHKLGLHPDRPETLFAQDHGGVYRSDDAGRRWRRIDAGLPAAFGFPVVVDPADPDTVYVIPLVSDSYRCTPEGRCRVYRSRDGGASWEPLAKGLPQRDAHVTVLRDAFVSGGPDPGGLYFGTRGGEVYASRDAGESWETVAAHLPAVLCVRAAPAP